ncbi:MAG TPA: glutamate synthase subunit beta [Candidatus Limnocylindrales bacterium]|jgi:glutamate synthase (NADPH/NADH) small chain
MGKSTGFMEFGREPAHVRAPLERLKDWSESHPGYEEATLRQQGARCMDCGIPYCHAGALVNGLALGCPVHNLIPEWNDLVYRGQWREAIIRLHRTNNFPEFTGRVCPAPCEGSCTLGIDQPPVTIKTIENEIIERAFLEGWVVPEPPLARTGMKVAVVGSGPAGLAAAAQLNKAGHMVTVYERSDRIGGLLVYGIPNMKLDKAVVERRVRLLEAEGIGFVRGTAVGEDVAAEELANDFDAIVLATGSTIPRDLKVEGRELAGVHFAMDFLVASTRTLLGGPATPISAAGKNVIVIGGGDTGTDCVGTAIRQGAKSVVQLEILPRPPETRAADNPWPQWPKVYKLDYGQEEAAALWGADPRRYLVNTRRFVGDEAGRVRAIETVDIEWAHTAGGRPEMRECAGTENSLPAHLVLIAMGFVGPEPALPTAFGCKLDHRGNIVHDEDFMTTAPGVFAAGDCSRGQSLVVWAINEGRLAARAVDKYLMFGESVLPDY